MHWRKLSILGFSDHTVKWFRSYLSNRSFSVNSDSSFSEILGILRRVSQGSMFDPLLFFINVDEMPMAIKCNLFLYADDKCPVFQRKNDKDIEKQLNEDFANISHWSVDIKLIIHFVKYQTLSIRFAFKRNIKKFPKLDIVNNNQIK